MARDGESAGRAGRRARGWALAIVAGLAAGGGLGEARAAENARPAGIARPAGAARPANADSCLYCAGASEPEACHRIAVELATARDFDRAIPIEEHVLAKQPYNPEVAAALARMYHQGRKNSARAVELYHVALYAAPGYPPALLGLGQLMQDKGELAIAARYFDRGVRERPDLALFRVHLAETLVRAGRDAEAQPVLEEIVARFPGSAEAEAARKLMSRPALARP